MTKTLAPIAALLLSVSILLTGQGLQGTLLPVRGTMEGFPSLAIGAMGAAYFFGFTLGCLKSGELVKRVGHIRVFLAMGAVASAAPLVHSLVLTPLIWLLLRMITGFCFAALYVVIESWLNDHATNENRGLVFSVYAMITLTVLAAGQMMMLWYDPLGWELFVIASVLVSLGAVPVALSRSPSPQIPESISINLRELYSISPSGTMACLAAGLTNGAFWALGPVFGQAIGGVTLAAWFMTAAVVGGALFQWPLGSLSDRISRRKVLVGISLIAIVTGGTIAAVGNSLDFRSAVALGICWGGLGFPLYTIAVAYANDFADPDNYVMVSSGLLLMYGIGATVGPFIASAMMDSGHPERLFLFTSLTHLLLVIFVSIRFLQHRTLAETPIAFTDALSATQTSSAIYEDEVLSHDN